MELTRSRGQLRGFQDGISKHIEIDRDATVKALLDRVVALFGNIPAPHTQSLWTEKGVELTAAGDGNRTIIDGVATFNVNDSLMLVLSADWEPAKEYRPRGPAWRATSTASCRRTGGFPVAAMMARQIQHLRRLLDDLLDLARISRDRLSIRCAPTDIRQCVQDAVDANREEPSHPPHVLKLNLPAGPLVGEVDSTRIMQVISILLNNAIKYSPVGSSIELSLVRDQECARVSVRDEGVGIAADVLPHIFDPFRVTDDNDLARHGLGIGLGLARRLVELHAGTLVARSDGPGRGTELCVAIPLTVDGGPRGAPIPHPSASEN